MNERPGRLAALRLPQIRETDDLEMPVSLPEDLTNSSTLRVETPSIQAVQITE